MNNLNQAEAAGELVLHIGQVEIFLFDKWKTEKVKMEMDFFIYCIYFL